MNKKANDNVCENDVMTMISDNIECNNSNINEMY